MKVNIDCDEAYPVYYFCKEGEKLLNWKKYLENMMKHKII
jgi:hypothetical protein